MEFCTLVVSCFIRKGMKFTHVEYLTFYKRILNMFKFHAGGLQEGAF